MLSASSSASLLALALLSSSVSALTADEWRSKTIYQVVTDRFAKPDSVTTDCNVADKKYCGGTFNALAAQLPYIQGMGFDAIWISPVVTNLDTTTALGEAYHGYWSTDVSTINKHFGTADDLKALSQAVHDAGMYIMFDVVINHVAAQATTAFAPDSKTYGPFNIMGDYHPFCWIDDYGNQNQVEQCWLGDTTVALADLDTEDQTVIDYFNTWIKQLVSDYSVDGLRIDTAKHVRKDFWPGFCAASGVFCMGEILDGGVPYNAPYQEVMDSVLNYPLYYQLGYAFQTVGANLKALSDLHDQMATAMKDTTLLGTFLDNHDQPRYASTVKDVGLISNAFAYPFVSDGVPILYYGQEQGFTGGGDPGNREPMWTSKYDTSVIGYKYAKQLNLLRKAAGAADINFYTGKSKIVMTTSNELVIKKGGLVSILTNRGSSGSGTVTLPSGTLVEAAKVVDALTCTSWGTDKNGGSVVSIANGQAVLLIPLSDIGTELCPNGVTASSLTKGSTDTTPADPQTSTTRAPATTARPTTAPATGTRGSSASASATSGTVSGASKLAIGSSLVGSVLAVVVASVFAL